MAKKAKQTANLNWLTNPIQNVMGKESSGGIVLFISAALALIIANSVFAQGYNHFLHLPVKIGVGALTLEKSLQHFINEGLMAVFFFLVGLEIKREFVEGALAKRQQAILPLVAAVCGMVVPAVIYISIVKAAGGESQFYRGWAIPTATDIAFAVGIIALVGRGVPMGVKVLLVAIAIIDDLGAIIVIAVFYTPQIALVPLLIGLLLLAMLMILNFNNITSLVPYAVLAVILWICVLQSAVHATIAGVLTAFTIPLKVKNKQGKYPLLQCEHDLAPWVTFIILPLFGFVNAGVSFAEIGSFGAVAFHPLTLGIASGLFFGKQIGITASIYILVKCGFGVLPENCNWKHIYAVSLMCGIGFTISLFIGALSFEDGPFVPYVRIGIFVGSMASALLGYLLMRSLAKHAPATS